MLSTNERKEKPKNPNPVPNSPIVASYRKGREARIRSREVTKSNQNQNQLTKALLPAATATHWAVVLDPPFPHLSPELILDQLLSPIE